MKRWISALLAVLLLLSLTGCSGIRTLEAAEGSRFGALTGTTSVKYAALHGELHEYRTAKELVAAIRAGSIDCIAADERNVGKLKKAGIRSLSEPLAESRFRIAVAVENPDLIEDINSALRSFSSNGTLEDMINGHYRDSSYVYETTPAPEDAKTLKVAVCNDFAPYAYTDASGNPAGIDVDLARAICSRLGLQVSFRVVSSDSLVSEVKNGTAHFALGGITANSDRADDCLMSEPYATCRQILLTR